MTGGLLQLVATGSKDAPLTLNPEITFFKILYKKHTNFAIQQTIKNLGEKNFNTFNTYKLEKNGDLLLGLLFKINIPKFNIIKKNIDINNLEIIYKNYQTGADGNGLWAYIISKHAAFKIINYINKNITTCNIHRYSYDNFKTIIPIGPWCSQHSILDNKEADKILDMLSINKNKIKRIYINDPQIIWLGAKLDQIVRIDRINQITGYSTDYRRVVKNMHA